MNRNPEEITIEEKLKALAVLDEDNKRKTSKSALPKADSLHQMLIQALTTNDYSLLEDCLRVNDGRIISNTVQRISTSYVISFLTQVVQRFQKNPNRCESLAKWIKSILLTHMSYLMTNPSLAENLAPLYQTVDSRISVFNKLMKLQGRLDALDQQVRTKSQSMQLKDDDFAIPMAVYDEDGDIVEDDEVLTVRDGNESEGGFSEGSEDDEEEEDLMEYE
jgi:U3 small nucleolar RNA-associated protein 5